MFGLEFGAIVWDDDTIDAIGGLSMGIGNSFPFTPHGNNRHFLFVPSGDSGVTYYYDDEDWDEETGDYNYHKYHKSVKGIRLSLEFKDTPEKEEER